MPKKKIQPKKRAGIVIEQKDENRDYWIKVAPITFKELAVKWIDRKLVLIKKIAEYKLDVRRQLYIRVSTDKEYMLLWQPVNENYQPDEFTVVNDWISYKFVKMKSDESLLKKWWIKTE